MKSRYNILFPQMDDSWTSPAAIVTSIFEVMEGEGFGLADEDGGDLAPIVAEMGKILDKKVVERAKECERFLKDVPPEQQMKSANAIVEDIWAKFNTTVENMMDTIGESIDDEYRDLFDLSQNLIKQARLERYSRQRYTQVRDVLNNLNILTGTYSAKIFDKIIRTTGYRSVQHAFVSVQHAFDSFQHAFDSVQHAFDSVQHAFDSVTRA